MRIIKKRQEIKCAHNIGTGKAMMLFRQYLLVGGMPKPVTLFIENSKDFSKADAEKRDILKLYRNDIMKISSQKKYTITVLMILILQAAAVMLLLSSCGSGGASDNQISQDEAMQMTQDEAGDADNTDYDIDYLVLVNGSNRLPDDWEEKLQLTETTNSVGDKVQTEVNAYAAYLELKAALEEEGVHIELDSAYRSVAEQQKIVDEFTEKYGADYVASYVAVPGYSEHHTGLALDLYLIVDGVTVYENEDLMQYPEIWAKIHEKLPDYGFILRYFEGNDAGYSYEPWHIRYVGSPEVAREITERGITLEEYLADR